MREGENNGVYYQTRLYLVPSEGSATLDYGITDRLRVEVYGTKGEIKGQTLVPSPDEYRVNKVLATTSLTVVPVIEKQYVFISITADYYVKITKLQTMSIVL